MHEIDSAINITGKVETALEAARAPGREGVEAILQRAEGLDGLSLDDAAALLKVDDPECLELISKTAGRVKDAVFGPRVVLFAPLYLSNYCANDCLYCGFRKSNKAARRKALSPAEAVEQARLLSQKGFKRLLLVAGEHPSRYGVDYLIEVAEAIYARTDIRILHVNSAPVSEDEFRRLKAAGFGVYQCFQETYHRASYKAMHPTAQSTMKSDYNFRLTAMDRALSAGFGDVGIGALLGLYDYRYDALAAIAHSKYLEERYGAAAHTISVPRLRPAEGTPLKAPPHPVSDRDFMKVVSVYRLSVPYAGVVITTRESAAIREQAMLSGASQVSAGSSTEPGGYGSDTHSTAQFDVTDLRGLSEMVAVIARKGLLPSLCTSCYRSGRQGRDFKDAASSGAIKDFCTPNAILSLKEYILDGDSADRALLEETLERFVKTVDEPVRSDLTAKLTRVEKGERDIHY